MNTRTIPFDVDWHPGCGACARLRVGFGDKLSDYRPRHARRHIQPGRCPQRLGSSDGFVATTADGGAHAFLWDGTTLLDLGTLGRS